MRLLLDGRSSLPAVMVLLLAVTPTRILSVLTVNPVAALASFQAPTRTVSAEIATPQPSSSPALVFEAFR